MLGMSIGAGVGGKLIQFGRRLTLLCLCLVGCIGSALTLFRQFEVLLLGRVIIGFACGAQAPATMRQVFENCPGKTVGIGIGFWVVFQNIGAFICLMSGVLLPPKGSQEELDSNLWRWVFGFPIICYLVCALLYFTIVRRDSP